MQPTFFIPHGGGPCFFMDSDPADLWDKMETFLRGFVSGLAVRPKAILLLTAHWEEPQVTFSTNPAPDLLFDYYNFPPHTYELTWPAPSAPDISRQAVDLLAGAGIKAGFDQTRGYDHGVFVPMKVAVPQADIPVSMMSLRDDLDPAHHLAVGQALAPLRRENVLIVGSGMSFHNLRVLIGPGDSAESQEFDRWLTETLALGSEARNAALIDWAKAPGAKASHPREEHLAPVFVATGAAEGQAGRCVYTDTVLGAAVSAYQFG